MEKWSPIEADMSENEELLVDYKKQGIRNVLGSYTGLYDVFSELIQNALDAVEEREKEAEKNYTPAIWIHIDLLRNLVSVTDNGIGFDEGKFRWFLLPSVGFKKGKSLRGRKGVGATYLAYGFNFLQFGTKTPNFNSIVDYKNGREWVEDESGRIPIPFYENGTLIHDVFETVDRGSTFTVKLGGDNVRPKDLSWFGAETPDQWEAILRAMTPLGGLYFDSNPPKTRCVLKVTDRSGATREKNDLSLEYIYPHRIIQSCVNIEEIIRKQEELMAKKKDPTKLPPKYRKLNGIYEVWEKADLGSESSPISNLSDEEKELIETYSPTVYGFFCYTTDLWDAYDENVHVRSSLHLLQGGLRLAANSMIQGPYIQIPLTRYIGYQNTTHVIVHFDGAEPDLGRKGFQPELLELAKRISTGVVNTLKVWKGVLKTGTGAAPIIGPDTDLFNWISNQVEHEKEKPLIITGEMFFNPTESLAIVSEPAFEQDVVALFNQMLTSGVIRGIKILATSQIQKYDGVFRVLTEEPIDKYLFNKKTNPLGVLVENIVPGVTKPYVLEYKYNVDSLIEEFENEEKFEDHIDLVVAWAMGTKWQGRYEVTSLLNPDNLQHRPFHGYTHYVTNEATGTLVFYTIILEELIEYLKNPNEALKKQRKQYE